MKTKRQLHINMVLTASAVPSKEIAILNSKQGLEILRRKCVYIYVCVKVCMYIFMYVCIYLCIYVYVCMYVCMYVCIYVCMYVYNWMQEDQSG